MKRALALLLCGCLLLLLGACGKQPETPAEPSTEPVGEAEPAKPEPAVFSLKELPEIGSFVSDEKKAWFFEDGPHDTLEPRDDYGTIVPYCAGSEQYYATDWSYTDEETGETYSGSTPEDEAGYYERFGFCTADGRIITGGLFDDVFCCEDENGNAVYVAFPEQAFEMCGEMYLVFENGKTVLHLNEHDAELRMPDTRSNRSGKALIEIRNYESGRMRLMDFSGKVVFDYKPDASGADADRPYFEYADKDGLVMRRDDENGTMRYCRWTYDGKEVLAFPGDYEYFRGVYGNGVAIMSNYSDHYRLVSMSGEVLADDCGDLFWSDYYNCFLAVANEDWSVAQCYDVDGKRMEGRVVEPFNTLERDYDVNFLFDEDQCAVLDASFRWVPLLVDNAEIVLVEALSEDWNKPGCCTLRVRTDDDTIYVFDNGGKRLAKLQDVLYDTYDTDEDGTNDEVRPGVEDRFYQLSEEGGVICAEQKTGIAIIDTHTNRTMQASFPPAETFRCETTLNDHVFALSYEKGDGTYQWYYDLYRRADGERFLSGAVYAERYGDYLVAATPTHSYLMDKTGKTLLCLKNDKLV